MNVLRDTHRALVPGGLLLDFHPVSPPWPSVLARGEKLGELRDETFLDDLRAADAGLGEVVRAGLFELLAERTHDVAEHYDDGDDVLAGWEDFEEWFSPGLRRRLLATREPVEVVERLVFRLYRSLP